MRLQILMTEVKICFRTLVHFRNFVSEICLKYIIFFTIYLRIFLVLFLLKITVEKSPPISGINVEVEIDKNWLGKTKYGQGKIKNHNI